MISTRIPGGLIKGGEFLAIDNYSMFMSGGSMVGFWQAPKEYIELLRGDMKSKPLVEGAMEYLVGKNEDDKLEQFSKCQFGALNNEPDIDENGNLSYPEYVPCNQRNACKVQGVGCCSIMVKEGIFLTKAETEVFKLVLWPDRIIAITLGSSEFTIKTHWKNIRTKMDLQTKGLIIKWATERGIILI